MFGVNNGDGSGTGSWHFTDDEHLLVMCLAKPGISVGAKCNPWGNTSFCPFATGKYV